MVYYLHLLNFTNDVLAVANSLSFLPTTYSLQSPIFIDMDNVQTAFVTHHPSYSFDLDMMKVRDGPKTRIPRTRLYPPCQRSMESIGSPDTKKNPLVMHLAERHNWCTLRQPGQRHDQPDPPTSLPATHSQTMDAARKRPSISSHSSPPVLPCSRLPSCTRHRRSASILGWA